MEGSIKELAFYRIDRNLSKIVKEASYLREKSDYDDFYIAVKADVIKQLENAKKFVASIQQFINEQ